jgi:3-phenylpropionate/trans-cinnamate dioxygenase ferredoxin reductase component
MDVKEYRYLIVGGGMTADAACRGIREHDAEGAIGLVSAEQHAPYARPPLSKALWGDRDEDMVWRGTAELGVDLVLGARVASLDLERRRAADDAGREYAYERLLLATGGSPRQLPSGGDGIVYFRTLDDYRQLRARAGEGVKAVVVGGGFIGSEIAAALVTNGCRVSMIFPEAGIGARLFPADLSASVNDYYRERGVDVLAGENVDSVDGADPARVVTGGGQVVEATVVVAGLGIEPATALAEDAGLEVDNGIVVDELGRAGGRDDVYAAGDVARFPVPALDTAMRVEHEDHANTHGAAVGANMAGADVPYDHLPFFYSDLFDLGYEAVGEVDARLDTRVVWEQPYRKGVVCYVDASGRPRGFLLWDVWGQVDAARALIRAGEPVGDDAVRALLG